MAVNGGGCLKPAKPATRPTTWTDDQWKLLLHWRTVVHLSAWGLFGDKWPNTRADMLTGRLDLPIKCPGCSKTWFELAPSRGRNRPWLRFDWHADATGNEGLFIRVTCNCGAPPIVVNMPGLIATAEREIKAGRSMRAITVGVDGNVAALHPA